MPEPIDYSVTYRFRTFEIPTHMMASIRSYIDDGVLPCRFLTAVIINDLKNAVGMADDVNICHIPAFVEFFYNHAPASCWGSREKMTAWMAQGGLNG